MEEYYRRKGLQKTPKKPLNDDVHEDIKIKNDKKINKDGDIKPNIKLNNNVIPPSWNPSASSSGSTSKAETYSVSGNTIRLSFYPVGNSSTPGTLYYSNSSRDALFKRLRYMSDDEFERQYDDNISRIAWTRVEGNTNPHERDYATEAALMLQYYDKVSYAEAKELVQMDTTAKIQALQEQRVPVTAVMSGEDDDQPF